MKKQKREKLLVILVLIGIIVLIVARFKDGLAACFLFLGKALSGDLPDIGVAGWFCMLLLLCLAGLIIAAIVFFVRLIILTIKAKGDDP